MTIKLKETIKESIKRDGYLKFAHCSCNDEEIDIDLYDAIDDDHVLTLAKLNTEGVLELHQFDEDDRAVLKSYGIATDSEGHIQVKKLSE